MTRRPFDVYPDFWVRIGRRIAPPLRTRTFATEEAAMRAAREQAAEEDWPMVVWSEYVKRRVATVQPNGEASR